MTRDEAIRWARRHGKPVQEKNAEVEYLFTLEGINALLAAEREACAKVCDARYMGDNNREDMEARRCAEAIRARGSP
jgi:hypothetical protein